MAVDKEALLRLVRASGDDEARIVYADWLEEQGEVARAQLIHLQCEQAKLSRWEGRALDVGHEIEWLLFEHGEAFLAELPVIDGLEWADFERGFVSTVRVRGFERLLQLGQELAAAAPLRRAEILPSLAVAARRDLASPAPPRPIPSWLRTLRIGAGDAGVSSARDPDSSVLAAVEELELTDLLGNGLDWLTELEEPALAHLVAPDSSEVGLDFVRALAKQPWGRKLRTLVISSKWVPTDVGYGMMDPDPRLGADGGKLLAKLDRLERLVVDRQRIASKSFGELLEKLPRLVDLSARDCGIVKVAPPTGSGAPLSRLAIPQNAIRTAGLVALVRAPRLAQLEALDVDTCEIESVGVSELAKSPAWQTLRWLDLSRNPLGASGARALAEAPVPARLATLRIADADFDATAANLLGKIGWLDQLVALDLSGNRIEAGASALRNFAPEKLRSLGLKATGLGRSEAAVLARFWPHLVHLVLDHNTFGDAGIERFAVMKEAPRLQSLSLDNCDLSDDALELFARARCPRLRRLVLSDNTFEAPGLTTLLRAPMMARVEVLDLSGCSLDEAAIAAIATAPCPRLRQLRLRANELPPTALLQLARSEALAKVKIEVDGTPYAYEVPVRDELAARFGDGWYRVADDT